MYLLGRGQILDSAKIDEPIERRLEATAHIAAVVGPDGVGTHGEPRSVMTLNHLDYEPGQRVRVVIGTEVTELDPWLSSPDRVMELNRFPTREFLSPLPRALKLIGGRDLTAEQVR